MLQLLTALAKQPWWSAVLVIGAILTVVPTIRIERSDSGYAFLTHPPTTIVPIIVGALLLASAVWGIWLAHRSRSDDSSGLDLSRVKDDDGTLWTRVAGCEVRVAYGRIEDYARSAPGAIVLPCNEYFDDRCVDDVASALGAYANAEFSGQVPAFMELVREEAAATLGPGRTQTKTPNEPATSFGTGRCLLLHNPLNRATPVALLSTTTQRAGEGLSSRISYLFDGMRALVIQLADARITEAVMPLMGAGHGHIDKPLALVGLLLALAEVARYGQGGQRLRRVTVVVFQRDRHSAPDVDPLVVRRALALIGDRVA